MMEEEEEEEEGGVASGEKCALRFGGWWRALCSAHGGLDGVLLLRVLSPCVGGGLYWYLAVGFVVPSRLSRPGRLMGGWQWGSSGDGDALAGVESAPNDNNASADDPGCSVSGRKDATMVTWVAQQ
jgi:hypothetical protein